MTSKGFEIILRNHYLVIFIHWENLQSDTFSNKFAWEEVFDETVLKILLSNSCFISVVSKVLGPITVFPRPKSSITGI